MSELMNLYCNGRDIDAEAELEKEVPVPAYRFDVPPGLLRHWYKVNKPACECGAVKCKTTHATWCPVYGA